MTFTSKVAVRNAWIAWAVLFLAVAAIMISGSQRSVVLNYRMAALNWVNGTSLYDGLGVGGFTYLPQSALLYLPFALLPETLSEVLWRLFNIAVFALGIREFGRLASGKAGPDLFPLLTLVSIPLAWSCARNGQTTLIMAGLMMFAVADISREKWWRATLWLMLSVAFKPLSIVLILLVAAIDRPMSWRVLVGLAALFAAPFLAQAPGYVMSQYTGFLQNTTTAAHVGAVEKGWTTLFNALTVTGINVAERVQTVIRLAAAGVTLALCWAARKRHDSDRSAIFVYTLAAAYLMLFSPRTENNTYAMLGPSIALFLASDWLIEKRTVPAALLGGMVVVMVASRKIERTLTPMAGTSWILPLMAVLFTAHVIARLFEHGEQRTASD
ncbi:MAG: DUF2029 domain-containing protein [Nitrospirota bacterium]|nr:DUF2029 domain-containing protein [Nitrospirota bacterium]